MFKVSYCSSGSRVIQKKFFSLSSALLYFLQKFHDDVPRLCLQVVFDELLEKEVQDQ